MKGFFLIATLVPLLVLSTAAPLFAATTLHPPQVADSKIGVFTCTLTFAEPTIPLNKIQQAQLFIKNRHGLTIETAHIKISGGMPAHRHGMPTQPRITKNLGQGRYLIDGLKFQMAGHWQLSFEITAHQVTDQVTFNLVLNHGPRHD